jgi:hypothetical protein
MTTDTELKQLVRDFFRILDIKEESEEGRIFSPTYISSCRVLDGARLSEILARMKEIVKE